MADATIPPLTDFDWAVRFEVYRGFAHPAVGPAPAGDSGADDGAAPGGGPGRMVEAPTLQALSRVLEADEGAVAASLRRLHANHHVAVFPDRDEVWMANPFSAVPTEYPVRTERGRYWAACAWDAFGVPALLGIDGVTETRCPQSGQPLSFGVRGGELHGDDGVIHLVVPLRDAWNDIGFT